MYLLRKPPKGLRAQRAAPARGPPRPVTRREFISQGFMTGSAVVMVPSIVSCLLRPGRANAVPLSADIEAAQASRCGITGGAGKIPFICFDLAGGANIAGSNVLIGKQGGQLDFLSTAGYSKLGLPGNMTPNRPMRRAPPTTSSTAVRSRPSTPTARSCAA